MRETEHSVIASVFADLADLDAFHKCKALGGSDEHCFNLGDNGIGCWGDSTGQEVTAMCALPPEDMIEKWGSTLAAKHKGVSVTYKEHTVICKLADRMPHKKNIRNGAGIDLNPAAVSQLRIPKGAMVRVIWKWEQL